MTTPKGSEAFYDVDPDELTQAVVDHVRADLQEFVAKVEAALEEGTLRALVLGLAIPTEENPNELRINTVRSGFDAEIRTTALLILQDQLTQEAGGEQ